MILSGRKIGSGYSLNKEGIAKKEDIKNNLSPENLEKCRKQNTSKISNIIATSFIDGIFLFEDDDGDIHMQSLGQFTRSEMIKDIFDIFDLFSVRDIDFDSETTELYSDDLFSMEIHPRVQIIRDLIRVHEFEDLKKMDYEPILKQVLGWEMNNGN